MDGEAKPPGSLIQQLSPGLGVVEGDAKADVLLMNSSHNAFGVEMGRSIDFGQQMLPLTGVL